MVRFCEQNHERLDFMTSRTTFRRPVSRSHFTEIAYGRNRSMGTQPSVWFAWRPSIRWRNWLMHATSARLRHVPCGSSEKAGCINNSAKRFWHKLPTTCSLLTAQVLYTVYLITSVWMFPQEWKSVFRMKYKYVLCNFPCLISLQVHLLQLQIYCSKANKYLRHKTWIISLLYLVLSALYQKKFQIKGTDLNDTYIMSCTTNRFLRKQIIQYKIKISFRIMKI